MGRMYTTRLMSKIESILRFILKPVLPLFRWLRSMPLNMEAKKRANLLQKDNNLSVCFLTMDFPKPPPARTDISHGGSVKLTYLAETFGHSYPHAKFLYVVSSIDNQARNEIVLSAKQRGLKIILNQNGVAYPGWHGPGWEQKNQNQKTTFDQADFIIYQSQFCKKAAETFLGVPDCQFHTIYNPVDIQHFHPTSLQHPRKAPILLLGGNQFSAYRYQSAVEILSFLEPVMPEIQLIVTGKLWGKTQKTSLEEARQIQNKFKIRNEIIFTGPYSQEKANSIFQNSDILLHTQFQDASPGLVGEALACGIPIVYSASGGTPELVGPDAGIGVFVAPSWDTINLPDPKEMAKAVIKIWENHKYYSDAARQRAVDTLSLETFILEHKKIFAALSES
jgi:glycosyltransferase involved in cell wall biosynthesis